MEFFLLFILNIFTGAVIYLILSLKIERTSATFQEQKLKKEMGEIITEFNSTAERNITLLENRISLLKKLLNEKGDFKGIDLVVDDENISKGKAHATKLDIISSVSKASESIAAEKGKVQPQSNSVKNDGSILVGIIDKISNINLEIKTPGTYESKNSAVYEDVKKVKKNDEKRINYLVDSEIDLSEMAIGNDANGIDTADEAGEEDIASLFNSTDDKYSLIAELHTRGYSVDDIARHSGLPSGEVRLVISLNR